MKFTPSQTGFHSLVLQVLVGGRQIGKEDEKWQNYVWLER